MERAQPHSNFQKRASHLKISILYGPFSSQGLQYDQETWTTASLFYENWPTIISCNIVQFKTPEV